MTTASLTFGTAFAEPPIVERALSDAGLRLRSFLVDATDFSGSVSLGEPRSRAREALDEAFLQATDANWDGEGAPAADLLGYAYARNFLALLPSSTPNPEAYVDPDGEICFEWYYGPRSVFSVSIGRDGTLTYAGLFGTSKNHGVEPFTDAIPNAIATNIGRARPWSV